MKTTSAQEKKKHPGGRPRKFSGASRPITVTLPDTTLSQLASISPDRAKAIVKATDAVLNQGNGSKSRVQIVEVAPGQGLIIVGPSRYLRKIPWLRMAEIAHARFILSIPSGSSADSLEIAIGDLLENIPQAEVDERAMLQELRDLMGQLRRRHLVSKAEILFVNTDKNVRK